MNSNIVMRKSLIVVAGTACFISAALTFAQVQSQTTTTSGTPTREVKIESGEVVSVDGNDLFVKMADGSLRHFPNIPASARVDVDGKQLSVSELQPGMKLERATVKTTTPQVVTTIETVTGKVWHVQPPLMVILTLANNENQQFKIPKGQKFMVNGTETDAWGLKKGMTVSATRITETPVTSVSQHQQVSGTMPAGEPVLIAKGGPTSGTAVASNEAGSATLPKTASDWPLVGILGLLLMSASLGIASLRRRMGLRV
jgi:LPXTG-motif cell wall-anchored protein